MSKALKTEAVSLRLNPKVKYALELLSRKQYRSQTSVIEWAIDHLFGQEFQNTISSLWDIDESDRLVKLAIIHPELLNYEEQKTWKLIAEDGYLWRGRHDKNGKWRWDISLDTANLERIRSDYPLLLEVAQGEKPASVLPKRNIDNPKKDDIEDDIPF